MSHSRMTDAGGPVGDADFERLAARLAMLASEDGEADNAGRAVGAMARRIGLTGGDLKRIFLAGAASGSESIERERLEHQISSLRHSLTLLDADAQRAAWERDVLRAENQRLQARLDRQRTLRLTAAGILAAVLFVAITAAMAQLRPLAPPWPVREAALGFPRAAMVRLGGALLFREPERVGLPLVVLRPGQRVQVHRLVWKALFQWAEIEAPGGWTGYVLTTEIDLS